MSGMIEKKNTEEKKKKSGGEFRTVYMYNQTEKRRKKDLSEVGFEPTPTYVDQNAQLAMRARLAHLESGALDHSATLTATTTEVQNATFIRTRVKLSSTEQLKVT